MTLRNLTEKAKDLVPHKKDHEAVRVSDQGGSSLPAFPDPFHGVVDRMFEEIFRGSLTDPLFGPLGGPQDSFGGTWPRVDLEETAGEFRMTADVPGLEPGDLEVTLNGHNLVIKGTRSTEREDKQDGYHLKETYSGSFRRSIQLPAEVDKDKVEAKCRNGRLTVTLPKTAGHRSSGKKIAIK